MIVWVTQSQKSKVTETVSGVVFLCSQTHDLKVNLDI